MNIRIEQEDDKEKIRRVHLEAFKTEAEAMLVDELRSADIELISLVAEENGEIIGHILFSPVSIDNNATIKMMGLAPMAVLPGWQRKGVGTQLVNAGLKVCLESGYEVVVVLGHPGYYPRFGFVPAVKYGIKSEYEVPAEVFMLKELRQGALAGITGTVKYHPAFNEV